MKTNYEKHIEDFLDFIKNERNLADTTVKTYRSNISPFFEWLSEAKDNGQMRLITSDDLTEYIIYRKTEDELESTSLNLIKSSIGSFYKYLIKKGLVTKNITDDVENQKVKKTIPKALTLEESIQMLDAVDEVNRRDDIAAMRVKLMIRMFLFLGLRTSELTDIKHSHIINGELMVFSGKGDKQRLLPIPQEVLDLVEKYKQLKANLGFESNYLFVNNRDGKLSTVTVWKETKELFETIGKPDFSTHKLRSTFATSIWEATGDIYMVMKLMGHTDVKTTEKYVNASSKARGIAINKNPLLNRNK